MSELSHIGRCPKCPDTHDLREPCPSTSGGSRRKGDWMQTFTGRQFWPCDPRPEEIDILDIAHALSMQCRYAGHCTRFYSTAEHSVLVARAVEALCPEFALEALLHDASEAYLVDVPRPLKRWLANYIEFEEELEFCVAKRFGLEWPWHEVVKRADNAILADEKAQIMVAEPADWRLPEPPLGVILLCLAPAEAEAFFLSEFERLVAERPATRVITEDHDV